MLLLFLFEEQVDKRNERVRTQNAVVRTTVVIKERRCQTETHTKERIQRAEREETKALLSLRRKEKKELRGQEGEIPMIGAGFGGETRHTTHAKQTRREDEDVDGCNDWKQGVNEKMKMFNGL